MAQHGNQWWHTDESNDTVATKRELWHPLAERMGGFDLDPAAGAEKEPIADTRYTEADDGLTSPWFGTVWLNPPYSDKAGWYKRLVDKYQHGDVERAVALATCDTSAGWFQQWFSTADVLCYLDGRDWYDAPGDSPSFQTQVGVWAPTDAVIEYLHTIGTVVRPVSDPNTTALTDF
jgi:hypothetical protein